MSIILRAHQQRALNSVLDHWFRGGGNPLISHCVGSGKSLTIAAVGKRILTDFKGTRVLCLTMTKELIQQNHDAAISYWPAAPVGINSAGLGKREVDADFLFAHPLSVYRNPKALGPRHVVIIDEVHNVSRKQQESVYGKIFAGLRELVPDMRLMGASGTIWRLDSGRLTDPWRGEPSIWDKCVDEYTITDGIADGYLVEPVTRRPETVIDVSAVRTRGGEFIESDLQAAVDKSDVNEAIVDELILQSRDRRAVVVFATGVQHAGHLQELLKAKGQSAVCATSEDEKARDAAIDYFKRGAAKFLVNVGVATTGFNHPPVDCIALARPTQSSGLLIQMIGRGLRTHPGKADCLVLDFAGNVPRLGCIDTIDGRKTEGVGGKAPTKTCPHCTTIVPASSLVCKQCGHAWPAPKPDLHASSVDVPVLSTQQDDETMDVQTVSYSVYRKRDATGAYVGQPSLLISYFISYGLTVREWLAFESPKPGVLNFMQRKWAARCTTDYLPTTTAEAYANVALLRKPGRIRVRKNGKNYDVVGHDFSVPPLRERIVA